MENEFDELNVDEDTYSSISIVDEFGDTIELFVINSVEHKGVNYLLVVEDLEDESDESEAAILKEVAVENGESVLIFVDDEQEFFELVKIFENDTDEYEFDL